jgi:hypothetical protein
MSFIELLRLSRSKPVTAVHKFLTNFNPSDSKRVYAFVEGEPDRAYYHAQLSEYAEDMRDIFVYNCEGKRHVYDAYEKISARHPTCTRVLFFVDKDIDDILGKPWPTDPRIFVTEYYSIENYMVCREVLSRFFADYVKLRRVEVDLDVVLGEFDQQLARFHRMIIPIMAWVVLMRRAGNKVMLAGVNLSELLAIGDSGVMRRPGSELVPYLLRVTQTPDPGPVWRDVRRTCRELRRLDPKRYVRGKFEAWWFIQFARKIVEDLIKIAGEECGSVSVQAQLHENSYIQLLCRVAPRPASLEAFLRFHLIRDLPKVNPETQKSAPVLRWIRRFLNP